MKPLPNDVLTLRTMEGKVSNYIVQLQYVEREACSYVTQADLAALHGVQPENDWNLTDIPIAPGLAERFLEANEVDNNDRQLKYQFAEVLERGDETLTATADFFRGVAENINSRVNLWVDLQARLIQKIELLSRPDPQFTSPLTENDRSIILAMGEIDADKLNPTSSTVILRAAIYAGDSKRAFTNLKSNGLVNSKTGRSGGYWLTDPGLSAYQQLKENSGTN